MSKGRARCRRRHRGARRGRSCRRAFACIVLTPVCDKPPSWRFFLARSTEVSVRTAFPASHSFEFRMVAKLKIRKEKKDIRQLRCVDGAAMSKIVNCAWMRCTASRRPALRKYQPDHRLSYPGEFHEAHREDPDGHRSGMCRPCSGTGRSAFAPCVSFRSSPPSRVPLGAVTATFPGLPGTYASFRQIRRGL